jgi:two-component system OmpR family sensor kinase
MTSSLQRRISVWLSIFILIAGLIAASASFLLALSDASESQDIQLDEVAAALSRQAFDSIPPDHLPKDAEEAESRFVIAQLGVAPGASNPSVNFVLPLSLPDGLQTIRRKGQKWRVMVSRDSNGKRFAVAQTLSARDEDAVSTALLVLAPLALLIPALLIAVRIALRRAFAPLLTLSQEADRVDGSNFTALRVDDIPSELQPFVLAVNRLLQRLGTAIEQQRRLISDAAHELRSPVAALTVQTENIRSATLAPDDHERVAALHRGLARIALLIEQLLGFARVQGRTDHATVNVALDEVVRAAIEATLPLARSKNIDLGCTRLDDVQIIGTQQDAYALVRNAIDNAVRYTPPDGSVDVSVQRVGRAACFIVEDTGPGIPPDDLRRVFEPFVRILGNRETGSGLGLAIANGAAMAMGGHIELSNATSPATGLRFTYRQAAIKNAH